MSFLPVKLCEELLFGNAMQRENGLIMLKALAQMGHASAHMQLGIHYQEGQFLPKNLILARKHYSDAARLGISAAARNLAILYQVNLISPAEKLDAITLYEQAANSGDGIAAYNLGILYQVGEGVAKDHLKAKTWYEKSMHLGYKAAKARISELTLTNFEPKGGPSNRAGQKNSKSTLKAKNKVHEARTMPKAYLADVPKNYSEWIRRAKPNSLWERLKGQGFWL